jgi:hypothetical protein
MWNVKCASQAAADSLLPCDNPRKRTFRRYSYNGMDLRSRPFSTCPLTTSSSPDMALQQ